jgi:hypothetical protein
MRLRIILITLYAGLAASAQIGTLQNGRYRHIATGVEFTLPAGWSVLKENPSPKGDTVTLMDSTTKLEAAVWMRAEKHPSEQIQKLLLAALDAKAASRADLTGYQMRSDSIQPRVINGKQGLSAVADFNRNGRPAVEVLTWIFSPKTHALFYGRAPAGSFDTFRARLDAIVNSAVVP